MKKMYMTGDIFDPIKVVDVVRETKKTVWIMKNGKEKRHSMRSSWNNYFNTWSEAREFLIEKQKARIISILKKLEYEENKLGKLERIPVDEVKND